MKAIKSHVYCSMQEARGWSIIMTSTAPLVAIIANKSHPLPSNNPPPPVLRCVSPYQPTFNARHIHIAIMHPQLSDMASF